MLQQDSSGPSSVGQPFGASLPSSEEVLPDASWPRTPLPVVGAGPMADRVAPVATERNMQALTRQYCQTRDPRLREALILFHQRLVHYVAARFTGGGEALEDLIQVGNIGLINALDRYDPSRDVRFSTYAMPTIVGEIKRHFRDKTWHVKVPRWLQEQSVNARKAQQALSVTLGRSPTVAEVAAALDASEEDVLKALEIDHITRAVSLDTGLDTHADGGTLLDLVGRTDSALHDVAAHSDLRRALGFLDERERQVLHLRFFEELSQAKISRELGISQMHVSRLQQRALRRLRHLLADDARLADGVASRRTSLRS